MKYIFLFLLLLPGVTCFSQAAYWQQEANFTINVSLNDATHTLDGFESIEYINHSPDTLRFIWFHLWPNAYKNDRTAFSGQLLENGRADFYFSKPADKGYINRLDFKANGARADIENTKNIDVVKVVLPKPLAPGKKTIISTPFHVQLPAYFSRSGHVGQNYQVTQWFPKPAVYDAKGWHPMPYLDQGEFYSEFGNFEVHVTVPQAYTVAATGVLQDAGMLKELKEKGRLSTAAEPTRTWQFKQNNVHDFAWFAAKELVAKHDTLLLASGKLVDVFSYYKKDSEAWKKSLEYMKDGLRHYSTWLGDYPYSTASIVEGPDNVSSGGMEYPTIALITTYDDGRELDATIVHEVGHNWLYGALASNEREHPWMDEGMNTYYQKRYETLKYGAESALNISSKKWVNKLPADEERLVLQTVEKIKKDQPVANASESFSEINYGLMLYVKAPEWMRRLEKQLGAPMFDSAMRHYFATWKNRHPSPENFKQSIEEFTGLRLDDRFRQLQTTGALMPQGNRPVKLSFLFNLKNTGKFNYVSIAPAIGFNKYDKVMPGLMVHNYQLPLNKVNFHAGALYATGPGKLNSFGRVAYNIAHQKHDLEAAVSFLNFSINDFKPGNEKTVYQRVSRLVPSLKLTIYNGDPSYKRRFTVQWKTFLLKEDALKFYTEINGLDTLDKVNLKAEKTTINRLSLTYNNTRLLYPYSVDLTTDQGKEFIRLGLTAKYYFNYADNKSGLQARFFAGKFFYSGNRTSSYASRYTLNMSGANGNEDYTYCNYFIGRNEYDGLLSQQMMERDGFFKVRTDLLSDKIGKTDDWLVSLNLVTDLPDNVNPLQVLPLKIPLKIFADIGTYADAWQQNPPTGRFLYDAGLQIPLFGSIVNVYIPILYSKVYSSYFKSTITEKRFLKNISFSIDIQKLQLKKILPGIPL